MGYLTVFGGGHLPSVGVALLGASVLGVVHGVTPDEHTWPITFSYAVGSFSARRGMRSALAFSLAFTIQRALLSELAYLGLLAVRDDSTWNAAIYLVVGLVMVLAGLYVLRLRCTFHLHLWPPHIGACHRRADQSGWVTRTPSPGMAAVHGFIAGWGFGAFALIMATVLAPAMPSAALGWMPGALFGVGTTVVLAGAGALIGTLVRHRRLREDVAQQVAQEGASWTLLAGGGLFAAAGLASLIFPSLMSAGIPTGIHVYNLDWLGLGTALIAGVVLVALIALAQAARRLHTGAAEPTTQTPPQIGSSTPRRPGCAEHPARPTRRQSTR